MILVIYLLILLLLLSSFKVNIFFFKKIILSIIFEYIFHSLLGRILRCVLTTRSIQITVLADIPYEISANLIDFIVSWILEGLLLFPFLRITWFVCRGIHFSLYQRHLLLLRISIEVTFRLLIP